MHCSSLWSPSSSSILICGEGYELWSSSLCTFPSLLLLPSLTSRYAPYYPVLKHPESLFLP
jgi:hypothetical protein